MTNADKYGAAILLALLRHPEMTDEGIDCYMHKFRRGLPAKVKKCNQYTSCEKCRDESIAWLESEVKQ